MYAVSVFDTLVYRLCCSVSVVVSCCSVLLQSSTWMSHVTNADSLVAATHMNESCHTCRRWSQVYAVNVSNTLAFHFCCSFYVAVSCCSLLLQSPVAVTQMKESCHTCRWWSQVYAVSVSDTRVYHLCCSVSVAVSCCSHPDEWVMSHMHTVITRVCCQCLQYSCLPPKLQFLLLQSPVAGTQMNESCHTCRWRSQVYAVSVSDALDHLFCLLCWR